MKTLDEVITDLKNQIDDELNCEYSSNWIVSKHDIEDALHYLKEYRQKQKDIENMRLTLISVGAKEDNPPMAWDELKQMAVEGKPVWIEYNLNLSDKFFHRGIWIIIQRRKFWLNDEVITYNGYFFCKREMGEYWQAYRKERE